MTPNIPDHPPAPSQTRFTPTPWEADGKIPPLGAMLLSATVLLAGLVLGYLAGIIGQWFYLILIFPFGIGIGIGLVEIGVMRFTKIRSHWFGMVVGFFGGLVAVWAMHYVGYQKFLKIIETDPRIGVFVKANPPGFLQYVDLMATDGVTLSRVGRGDRGMNLGYIGSYIYWLVELAIITLVAAYVGRSQADTPFCQGCGMWMSPLPPHALYLAPADGLEVMRDGDLPRLLQMSVEPETAKVIQIEIHQCAGCEPDGDLVVGVNEAKTDSEGSVTFTSLGRFLYPGAALAALRHYVASQQAAALPPVEETPPDSPT